MTKQARPCLRGSKSGAISVGRCDATEIKLKRRLSPQSEIKRKRRVSLKALLEVSIRSGELTQSNLRLKLQTYIFFYL